MEKLRIVYLGTPDFAVEPLRRLVEKQKACAQCGYEVVGVVTMPDKMINKRGNQLLMSPVKQYAVLQNLPVLQPESLKDEAFQSELRALGADLQIVVAFRMLPESVWNMPRLGTFNLHASLLPQYRGAAPINWAIINGDKETGVTTFFLKHEIFLTEKPTKFYPIWPPYTEDPYFIYHNSSSLSIYTLNFIKFYSYFSSVYNSNKREIKSKNVKLISIRIYIYRYYIQ